MTDHVCRTFLLPACIGVKYLRGAKTKRAGSTSVVEVTICGLTAVQKTVHWFC